MQTILDTYSGPNRDFRTWKIDQPDEVDVLRPFAEVCRQDLSA
jgi:hypothetical protein